MNSLYSREFVISEHSMGLEELEKKLYQQEKQEESMISSPEPEKLGPKKNEAEKDNSATNWFQEKTQEKKEKGYYPLNKFGKITKWLFWIIIAGVLIAAAVAGFYIYQYLAGRDAALSLKSPNNTFLGVPFNIEVDFRNNSDKPLEETKLSMILPENTTLVVEGPERRVFERYIGYLAENESFQEKIPVVIFGNEESLKRFEVSVSYLPPALGPRVRFEKTSTVKIALKEPAIKIDMVTPQKVLNNEEFEIEINYQNISDIEFSNAELQMDYPDFFKFKEASSSPSVANNLWKIGNLTKNSSKETLIIRGSVIKEEGTFFEIKSSVKIEIFGRQYLINEKIASLSIAPSPISLTIGLNDNPNYLSFTNDNLKYALVYRNNSGVELSDVVISARLVGEMFDFKSLNTQGFFNSANNTITWNTANTPALRYLLPGTEGAVRFEIRTKSDYPIKRVSDKNFVLKIEGEISSPTVPYYVASSKTVGIANFETKVGGKIAVDARALFYDYASGITNKGNLPPKVNKPTNYTVHWIITNYSTDVRNVEVRAFLQSGVFWTGMTKSNISAVPTYNERTQEVVWFIDKIPATKGIISKPIEAIFQIEATPNVTQISRQMPLLNETSIQAFDEFANVELKNSDAKLTTILTDDPNVRPELGIVQP